MLQWLYNLGLQPRSLVGLWNGLESLISQTIGYEIISLQPRVAKWQVLKWNKKVDFALFFPLFAPIFNINLTQIKWRYLIVNNLIKTNNYAFNLCKIVLFYQLN